MTSTSHQRARDLLGQLRHALADMELPPHAQPGTGFRSPWAGPDPTTVAELRASELETLERTVDAHERTVE